MARKKIKKMRATTKGMAKKTGSFLKKTGKRASGIASTLEKQWKKERPQREKLKQAANRALEHGVKIGGDVFETIRKDVNEIKRQGRAKNK